MTGPAPEAGEPADFPVVPSSFAAGLSARRMHASDPGVVLDGERQFVDEILAKLSTSDGADGRTRRYVRGEEIGRGGMGAVYRVLDTDLRRTLAMKVALTREVGGRADDTSDFVSRFLEEAQVTGQLDHPGIVPLHEVGMDAEGRLYFTMRLVKGRHLGAIFAQARRGEDGWSVEKAVGALVRVCEAMAYAHSKGVVHRDLKPANVMAGRFGEVYVMDWGLCKVRGRPERAIVDSSDPVSLVESDRAGVELGTEYGRTMGTPAYMSPEQGRGEWEAVDHRSDVYSVGAMLYELLTGRAPYVPQGGAVPTHTVLQWLLEHAPRPPRELDARASPELCAICERAMAREPEKRYPGMLELADDLRNFLAGRPVEALKLNAVRRAWRWTRRNPRIAAFMAAALLGGGAAMYRLAQLPRSIVRAAAEDDAHEKTELLTKINAYYAESVVDRVNREHVTVTHDYRKTPGAIPIPATMLTEVGSKITAERDGLQVRHYSDYPFRFRGPAHLDEFGREALAALRVDPAVPFFRYEEVAGRLSLRYAVPRVMTKNCVDCHNGHPDNTYPGTWKVGDVRGVLEIVHPIDQDERRTTAGLTGTFLVAGGIFAALMLLAVVLLVRAGRRAQAAPP